MAKLDYKRSNDKGQTGGEGGGMILLHAVHVKNYRDCKTNPQTIKIISVVSICYWQNGLNDLLSLKKVTPKGLIA